jgi:hypothetical protein
MIHLWASLFAFLVIACQLPKEQTRSFISAVEISETPTETPTATPSPTPTTTRTKTPTPKPTFNLPMQCEAFRIQCDKLRSGDDHGNPLPMLTDDQGARIWDCGVQTAISKLNAFAKSIIAGYGSLPDCVCKCPEFVVPDGCLTEGYPNPMLTNDPTPEPSPTEIETTTPTPEVTP